MAIFNSYVKLPEGIYTMDAEKTKKSPVCGPLENVD